MYKTAVSFGTFSRPFTVTFAPLILVRVLNAIVIKNWETRALKPGANKPMKNRIMINGIEIIRKMITHNNATINLNIKH